MGTRLEAEVLAYPSSYKAGAKYLFGSNFELKQSVFELKSSFVTQVDCEFLRKSAGFEKSQIPVESP
jgi:hypothetical protein